MNVSDPNLYGLLCMQQRATAQFADDWSPQGTKPGRTARLWQMWQAARDAGDFEMAEFIMKAIDQISQNFQQTIPPSNYEGEMDDERRAIDKNWRNRKYARN